MPITIETYDEFVKRNGGRLVKVGARWLLPSGAAITNNGFGPVRHEPPAHDHERLQVQRQYWAAKVERVEKDFETLKAALSGLSDGTGALITFTWPQDEYGDRYGSLDGIAALRRLASIVKFRRNKLKAVENELAATPQEKEHRRRAELAKQAEHEQRQRHFDLQNEISKIEI